ncbi:MAG: TlpA family protein disulfide reductase [Alphaproteobacteria bacterium]
MSAFVFNENLPVAPDVTFENDVGSTLRLADFEGRVILLNLWATWCGPCVHEMPSLDRLQAQRGGKDFIVIALSSDRGEARAVDPFFEETGLTELQKFYDPMNEMGRALGVRGLPTTLLIDAQGREVGRLEGPAEWDSEEALALIDAVL